MKFDIFLYSIERKGNYIFSVSMLLLFFGTSSTKVLSTKHFEVLKSKSNIVTKKYFEPLVFRSGVWGCLFV